MSTFLIAISPLFWILLFYIHPMNRYVAGFVNLQKAARLTHSFKKNLPSILQGSSSAQCLSLLAAQKNDLSSHYQGGYHVVHGVVCRELVLGLPVVGNVRILEATAEAQDELVNQALYLEGEQLLQQTTKGMGNQSALVAGDPYGAVLWPAAWAVANYILTSNTLSCGLDHTASSPSPLEGLRILELGTGTGLVSIAAVLAGATVTATDYEPLALTLVDYAATKFHSVTLTTTLLDMCDYNTPLPIADLVVAADIMYEPKTGIAMAYRAVEALRRNSQVIVGDSPGRPGRPAFLKTLHQLGVVGAKFTDVVGRTCTGPRNELICGKGSTSVSDKPQELSVAIMDLNPNMLRQ